MNLVKKVRLRRKNETLPRAKFLTAKQPQKSKNRGKTTTKIPKGLKNKKVLKRPAETTYPK